MSRLVSGLPKTYIPGTTRYEPEEIIHLHNLAEVQIGGLLSVFGSGVAPVAVGDNPAEDSLKVSDEGGGVISIAPGAGVLIDADGGPSYFELPAPVFLNLTGSSPVYVYPYYTEAPEGTTEDTLETGLASFMYSTVPPPDGLPLLATVAFTGTTVNSISDGREFLGSGSGGNAQFEDYDALTSYDEKDTAVLDGVIYRSKVGSNLGNSPAASPDEWEALGSRTIFVETEADRPDPATLAVGTEVVVLETAPVATLSPPMEITQDYTFTAENRARNRVVARGSGPIVITLPDDEAGFGLRAIIHNATTNLVTVTGAPLRDNVTESEIPNTTVGYGDTLEALGTYSTDSGTLPPPPGFLKDGLDHEGLGRIVYAFT